MKIDWDFVQRIHRMLKECPDKEKEYKALYPEAFKKTNVSHNVSCKLTEYNWSNLKISFIGKPVGIICFTTRMVMVNKDDENYSHIRTAKITLEPGFKAEWGEDGIKIWKYGPLSDKEKKKKEEDDSLPF